MAKIITREKALKILTDYIYLDLKKKRHELKKALEVLREPERLKGEWIFGREMIYCSECSHSYDKCMINDLNFCPECGTDMRKEI